MLTEIRDILWSLPTVGFITGTGIYFTVKSRFYPIRNAGKIIKSVTASENAEGISPLKGLMTSLGGTVGVGSITGVALALRQGGAGAIFWMWISSFFCMMLKYAENYITVKGKQKDTALGSASVLLAGLGKKKTAACFAVFALLASFGSGNMAQANAVSEAAISLNLSPLACGAVFSLLLIPAVAGGQRIIARINGILVPIAGIFFICVVLGMSLFKLSALKTAITDIFSSAFGLRQAAAGFSGAAVSAAIRTGVSKGVFSHEAGMGSSPMAHSAADTTPLLAGNFGVIEVFADTFIVSTVTALALIMTDKSTPEEMFFSFLGNGGGIMLLISVGIFAYAAVISWCFYSESCISYLFGNKKMPRIIYRCLCVIFAFLGCVGNVETVWVVSDIFNALMLFPNMYAVILKRKELPF